MKTVWSRTCRLGGIVALAAALVAAPAQAQTTTMPSTLRYGSGLMDIPVATVLPNMEITGTYSGFFVKLNQTAKTDASGAIVGFGPGSSNYYQDGSVAIGLANRAEVGATIQSLSNKANGGKIMGVFGRLELLRPTNQGIALAVGGRYVNGPNYGDGVNYEPNRLGIPDYRFTHSYNGAAPNVNTKLSLYGVASAHLRGFDGGFLPKNDLTFVLGYGTGMFKDGKDLSFYDYASSNGWFFGSAVHFKTGESSLLTLMGEYNGFDANIGAQLDVHGVRVGAQYLAVNYGKPTGGYYSVYRKPKFGILASLAICPGSGMGGFLCKPHLMKRPAPKVVQLPAPPPDTVRITRQVAPPLPEGTPSSVCLSTGESVQIRVSAQGDTLVGPKRVAIGTLRPGVVFAGTYAEGATWYQNDSAVKFEKRSYSKSGTEVRLDCQQIMRVGENEGVPLFVTRDANRPYETVYVPVRPGFWQAYKTGLRRTRG